MIKRHGRYTGVSGWFAICSGVAFATALPFLAVQLHTPGVNPIALPSNVSRQAL